MMRTMSPTSPISTETLLGWRANGRGSSWRTCLRPTTKSLRDGSRDSFDLLFKLADTPIQISDGVTLWCSVLWRWGRSATLT
jgi:hypothetical protein